MTTPTSPRSLLDLLAARSGSGRCRFVSFEPRSGDHRTLTCQQLGRDSAAVAAGLRRLRAADADEFGKAEHVVLVLPDPLAFVVGFFASMRSGLVPVPAPGRPLSHPGQLRRLRGIAASTGPVTVLTVDELAEPLAWALGDGCRVVTLDDLALAGGHEGPEPAPADTAYVQYTSGSIAAPKPIGLTHRNVLAQLAQAAEAYGEGPECVSVNWVPLYHDMGLVTGVLRPLWSDYPSVLLDPLGFVRAPASWPHAMTVWRATHTSSPDFGYSLCVRKTADPQRFDLRHLRVARSAGEPVRAQTLRSFAKTFGPAGFDYAAFKPSYGLAEATLTVTTCSLTGPPTGIWLSTQALREGAVRLSPGGAAARELVSCGPPLRDTRVEILDRESREVLGPEKLGEVWVAGPQVAAEGTATHLVGDVPGHLTGDIGFLHEGELYLVGRNVERFQVAGENFYSGELESVVGAAHDRLRPGRAAVFLGRLDRWPEPAVAVVAECRDADSLDQETCRMLAKRIVGAVGREFGLSVRCVWLVRAGSVPVTTSGKIERERCRTAFESRTIPPLFQYDRGEKWTTQVPTG